MNLIFFNPLLKDLYDKDICKYSYRYILADSFKIYIKFLMKEIFIFDTILTPI